MVKQCELVRYFGFVKNDYTGKSTAIAPHSISFHKAYLQHDLSIQKDLLSESIISDTFDKNNSAIKGSDSDIDPPKLFLKAIVDSGGIYERKICIIDPIIPTTCIYHRRTLMLNY